MASFTPWSALAGGVLMAVPAFTGAGQPYLSDYVPSIDHPSFWTGLGLVAVGVALQASVYLAAWNRARRPAPPGLAAPEALGMAVGAVAMLLATAFLRGGHPPGSGIVNLILLVLVTPLALGAAAVGLRTAPGDVAGPVKRFYLMTGVSLLFAVVASLVFVLKFLLGRSI